MLQGIVKKGKVRLEEIPKPTITPGTILIAVAHSCISAGTEVFGVRESGKSLVERVMHNPEKIKKGIDMIRSGGLETLVQTMRSKSMTGTVTGYSVSGIVTECCDTVKKVKPGDAVAASGAGFANHAEYVLVPEKLVTKIPETVSLVDASTVTLGTIALHGVRRANLKLGELCVVIGTGILGLIAVQLLKASGVRVAAVDLDENRLLLAKQLGAELTINPATEASVKAIENWTSGYGADGVIFAAATQSSDTLKDAFAMCKRKGTVTLLGYSGLHLDHGLLYSKEIDFQISCSYGPGRYDDTYEIKGIDYPYTYVRWTENRNMAEYLRLIQSGTVRLETMISNRYPATDIEKAFESLQQPLNKPIMVILDFKDRTEEEKSPVPSFQNQASPPISNGRPKKGPFKIAIVGAGNFAKAMHVPNILKMRDSFSVHAVMSQNGHNAQSVAQICNAAYATTEYEKIINDPLIDLVLICTRHGNHADLTLQALNRGKHVFVEKPLATTQDQLNRIVDFYTHNTPHSQLLFVGFNRRFSPYIQEIKKHVAKRQGPLFIHYMMNAGYIPSQHWTHEDGGRIIGEACHIIDVVTYVTNSSIQSISCDTIEPKQGKFSSSDNKTFNLLCTDGSVASIGYCAMGSRAFRKEYMEIHFDEKTIILDDYKKLSGFGVSMKPLQSKIPLKGHTEELQAVYEALLNGLPEWPIPLESMIQTTQASFLIGSNV